MLVCYRAVICILPSNFEMLIRGRKQFARLVNTR